MSGLMYVSCASSGSDPSKQEKKKGNVIIVISVCVLNFTLRHSPSNFKKKLPYILYHDKDGECL